MCSLSTFITFSKIMKKLFMCFLLTFLEIQICLLGITFRLTFCNSSKRLIKWFNNFSSFLVKNCYISFFPLHLHRIYFCFLYYHNFFFQFFYPWKDFYNIPTNNFLLQSLFSILENNFLLYYSIKKMIFYNVVKTVNKIVVVTRAKVKRNFSNSTILFFIQLTSRFIKM